MFFHSVPFLLFLSSSALAILTLSVGSPVEANTRVDVAWTREEGDPYFFDLLFLLNGVGVVGLASSVRADQYTWGGTTHVTFPSEGDFVLEAVSLIHEGLAESNLIEARGWPSSQWTAASPRGELTSTALASTIISTSTSASPDPISSSVETLPTPTSLPSKASVRDAAIIGSVLGGLILLFLIAIAILLIKRRNRHKTVKRLTFHPELMTQRRPPPIDVERARRSSTIPDVIVIGARPLPSVPPPAVTPYTPLREGPTERQVQLNRRMRQLEEMMHEIRFRPGMLRVLEQLRVQVAWLRAQRNSPWALGETDVPPPHYEVYML